MAASLQVSATFLRPAMISAAPSRCGHPWRLLSVAKSFRLEPSSARLTCSLQSDLKDFAGICSDAAKMAGIVLAASALVVSGANAEGVTKRLTSFDEIESKTWMDQRPAIIDDKYSGFEPASFTGEFEPGKVVYVKPQVFGGFTPIKNPNDDPHVVKIAKYAVEKYGRKNNVSLKLEKVVSGESQVVNGTNYRLVLAVKALDSSETRYLAAIYESLKSDLSLNSFCPISGPVA